MRDAVWPMNKCLRHIDKNLETAPRQEVEGDYTRLRELLLIEQFKNCLPNEVKTYLDENKALHRAATLADNYTLTHQKVFVNSDP